MGEDAPKKRIEVAHRLTEPGARHTIIALGPRSARQLVGQTLGPFRIESHLGSGGMGAVYCAIDERLGRRVALKLLASGGSADRPDLESLLVEARAAATIDHPNAVKIFDVNEIDGTPCLVMELVSGRTLRAFVRDPSISVRHKVTWLIDVARALAAAHAKGIVHQDVKPDNVMLGEDGLVKVLDFGIARRMVETDDAEEGAQTSWEIRGTAAYMAPERLRGAAGDALSDQFAWGVFAYELLTGRVPWPSGGGMAQLVDEILTYAPPPLFPDCPGVSQEVDRIVARAMAKQPSRRFPSMRDLVLALASVDLTAPPIAEHERTGWRRRALQSPAAALVVAVVGAALHGDVTAAAREAPPEATPAFAAPPDYGSTMPPNAEAVEAYRLGIQAMRAAAGSPAHHYFERAIALAPSFAAANLRKVLVWSAVTDEERMNVLKATELRDTLGEHDRALLQAITPWVSVPQDPHEVERRLVVLTANHPDPDYLYQLCRFRVLAGDYAEAVDACKAARERDPEFAGPIWLEGQSRLLLGDTSGGSAVIDECLRLSPGATACLNDFLQLTIRQGACDAALGYAERLVAIEPNDSNWLEELGGVVYATQVKPDVRVAFERWSKTADAGPPSIEGTETRARMAILAGDFHDLARQLDVWEKAVTLRSDEYSHAELFKIQARLAHEMGRDQAFVGRAQSFLASRAAWSPNVEGDSSIEALIALYRGGAMSRDDFAIARAQWLSRERSRPLPARLGKSPGRRWITAYAGAIVTREDALDAVAALPDYLPLPVERVRSASDDEPIGAAFLAAGDAEAALPFIRRAALSCDAAYSPFQHTWANVELGAILESRDVAGACAAYGVVIARWGNAPQSRSAARARDRWRQLGCH